MITRPFKSKKYIADNPDMFLINNYIMKFIINNFNTKRNIKYFKHYKCYKYLLIY